MSMQLKLRYRVLLAIGVALTAVFAAVAYFYATSQESAIKADYRRSLHKVTDSVSRSMQSVMLESHAEILRDYAENLKKQRGVTEFVILRADGTEAFQDNKTVDEVNRKLGSKSYPEHLNPQTVPNMPMDDPLLRSVIRTAQDDGRELVDADGQRQFLYLDAIQGSPPCLRCHDDGNSVRGVIKVVTPMKGIEAAILTVRTQSILIIGSALLVTMLFTGYVLGRSVVNPIEAVTGAMSRISSGDFGSKVPLQGGGDIRRMAASFNQMTSSLKKGYDLLLLERGKLNTVIEAAQEAIIVTDAQGEIVLVNASAATLLGKTEAQVRGEGFINIVDDPDAIARMLGAKDVAGHSETIAYRGKKLLLSAASISDATGAPIGSAALIRDVSEEHRLMDELKLVAITDALTDVYNRRYIDVTLSKEFDRSRRTGKPLSVLLLDIDFFKKFNDTHGHDQGDRVLQSVGASMKQVCRKYDSPCRYGGEEFVVILPATDVEEAAAIGERLRMAIEESVIDGLRVTISLGSATTPNLAVTSAEQLLEASDAALYQSKENGRNRLTTATLVPPAKSHT